jgi:hypothetical protein
MATPPKSRGAPQFVVADLDELQEQWEHSVPAKLVELGEKWKHSKHKEIAILWDALQLIKTRLPLPSWLASGLSEVLMQQMRPTLEKRFPPPTNQDINQSINIPTFFS